MAIETMLIEKRQFDPPKSFAAAAHIGQADLYERLWLDSEKDPVQFWEDTGHCLTWFARWRQTLEWREPRAKWYVGGTTNAAYNCLDRHVKGGLGSRPAIHFESEEGVSETITYQELLERVSRLANAMEKLGLRMGDTAAIYLPLTPEAVVAMLACARLGVTHSVIFGGFAAHAVRDRVQDAACKLIFTADYGMRRGQKIELKKTIDAAMPEMPTVENVIVYRRDPNTPLGAKDRDWQELTAAESKEHSPRGVDSEHPLFILYTSGTTGKPKGIVHSTGGYLVGVTQTAKWVFDLKPNDVYWCTADIGWITGHSYVVYGLLSNAATIVLYEGAPMHPHAGRIWEIIDKYRVTILYTAPTAIRAFMRAGDEHPAKYELNSLRLLGSVGEPINPEAWMWYHTVIGKNRCPIVDTWWQTETGAILISPLPGVTRLRPGSATRPFPGIVADVVDENGRSCRAGEGGFLVIKHPWPSMLRGIHGDPQRFKEQYFSKFPGIYFTGDGAHKDEFGNFWIKGRVDDVINVSGHRLGTMEVESALVSHPSVAEAAVVGRPDELKGQAIVAFVTPKETAGKIDTKKLAEELKHHVVQEIGSLARPEEIRFTKSLPKTRSGKIMRRFLKDLAAGREISGDTSTLENASLVEMIE